MKEIDQLVHFTNDIEILKSILKNGLYTSYSLETFCGKKQLVPMISFSNILYRDIGDEEVIDYGSYGISISREKGMTKYELNPVLYVSKDSDIEKSVQYNIQESILPQAFEILKTFDSNTNNCCGRALDRIRIEPLSKEIKIIAESINKETDDKLIEAYKKLFGKVFEHSLKQMLLIKSYKVKNKKGEEKIAYNEREWRKSFFNLSVFPEFKPDGNKNEKYEEWINTRKPHFKDENILPIDFEDILHIIVKNNNEKDILNKYIVEEGIANNPNNIFTLDELKQKESL